VTREVVQEETEAMRHGTIQHEHIERRVLCKEPLPKELDWLEPSISSLEKINGQIHVEVAVGLTEGLTPTEFYSEDVWVRGRFDLVVKLDNKSIILDWKTGKRKRNSDQLMLFAGFEFAYRPEIEEVRTGYAWLKDRKIDSETFSRKSVPMIWGHFLPKVERMRESYEKDYWPSTPSGLCGWCPATKAQCKNSTK